MKPKRNFKNFLERVKATSWLRVGDWEAPVLYEDIYCRGLRDYVPIYAKTDFGCRRFLHIKPITYITLEDYEPFATTIRERIRRNPAFLSYLTENFKQEVTVHEAIGTNVSRISGNITKLSDEGLHSKFEEYVESLLHMTPYSYVFSWGEEYIFGNLIREIIRKYSQETDHKKLENYFLKMTAPPSKPEATMIKYQNALLNLVHSIQKDDKSKNLFTKEVVDIERELNTEYHSLYSRIQKYVNEYGWLNTRHFLGSPIDAKEIIERIKELMEIDIVNEKKRRKEGKKQNERKFMKTIDKLGIESGDLEIVTRLREHVYLKSHRKELMGKVAFQMSPLFEEISSRMGLHYNEFVNLTLNEVRSFFNTREVTDLDTITERERGYAYIIMDRRMLLVTGKNLLRLKSEIVPQFEEEIRGQIANKGIARGIAKVILKKEDTNKLQTGDIFVTDMTNPDIAIAAQKCSAIVTDKGGMLCHAAILSRELGIPCIVGTDNATHVLKDGYRVEVDATKGIVRILEGDKEWV